MMSPFFISNRHYAMYPLNLPCIIIIFILCLLSSKVYAAPDYPLIIGDKDVRSGLFGIKDKNGNWIVEPIFQDLSFNKDCKSGYVKYNDKYYVVDRDFNIIINEVFQYYPKINPEYIIVNNSNNYYAITHTGKRISKDYNWLSSLDFFSNDLSGLLLQVSEHGQAYYTIAGIDFNPISTIKIRSAQLLTVKSNYGGEEMAQSAIICFEQYREDGLLPNTGLMNLKGEIIVPPDDYSFIEEVNLSGYANYYNKTAGSRRCSDAQLKRATVFLCYTRDDKVICYDMAGAVVFPEQKKTIKDKLIKKNMKKYIIPYLANADNNDIQYTKKVFYPYYDFYSRMMQQILTITDTSDEPNKNRADNILAIARSDKKKKELQYAQTQKTTNKRTQKRETAPAAFPPSIGSDALYFKTSKGGIDRCKITSYTDKSGYIHYQLWPYGYYQSLKYCLPGETLTFLHIGSKDNYFIFRGNKNRVKTDIDYRTNSISFDNTYTPLDIRVYIAHDFSWVKIGNITYNRRISKSEFGRLEQADNALHNSVDAYNQASQEYNDGLREIRRGLKNNPSSGGNSDNRKKGTSTTRSTCPQCSGRGYQKTRYTHAAASHSGWKSPYHNHAGTTCRICSDRSDHYHNPCTECHGYGHVSR